jgi:hypothetical protein
MYRLVPNRSVSFFQDATSITIRDGRGESKPWQRQSLIPADSIPGN